MVLLLGPHPDRRFYLLFHSRNMNRFYILAFYFVLQISRGSPDSDLDVQIRLDMTEKVKSHEDCPHKSVEHQTEGHGHGLHDLPGKFFSKLQGLNVNNNFRNINLSSHRSFKSLD